ncbi:hypothetical protein BKA67DRAFT_424980 [Truncatella angustata]|uniref:Uncharacterized protein n=1 Tax=Truncatella angustata TaxID=152316 RepID=A0A9P8RJN6_9PEZI|nr:uncharacterized protein BKA67DRAFT_424980 [Truncatella angustata]KAH6647054.1 hypothetical protein BKA67DRAFT_424980 [Truncatella angustata]
MYSIRVRTETWLSFYNIHLILVGFNIGGTHVHSIWDDEQLLFSSGNIALGCGCLLFFFSTHTRTLLTLPDFRHGIPTPSHWDTCSQDL